MSTAAHTCLRLRSLPGAVSTYFMGVNLELQDDALQTNLWDWLSDANVGVVRQFHPDKDFRTTSQGPWSQVATQADYLALRAQAAKAGDWNGFDFSTHRAWIGIPDDCVARLKAAGIRVLASPGCSAKTTGLLVEDDGSPRWSAIAASYAYHLEFFLHFGRKFQVKDYLLSNEPELSANDYRLEASDAAFLAPFEGRIAAYIRPAGPETAVVRERSLTAIARQHRFLVQAAMDAAQDAAKILGWRPTVAGPASLRPLELAHSCTGLVDTLDYHHYTWDPAALEERYRSLLPLAKGTPIGISELNLQSGPMRPEQSLLILGNALRLAHLAMTAVSLPRHGGTLQHVILYLFNHPCTQRNFKVLAYGDMNLVDWSGRDEQPIKRGPPPDAWAQRIRHPTLGHDAWAMVSRAAGGAQLYNLESSEFPSLVVEGSDFLRIWILRHEAGPAKTINVEIPAKYRWSCTRILDRTRRDEAISSGTVSGNLAIDIPGESLIQVECRLSAPQGPYTVQECGVGPGSLASLGLLQSVRLKVLSSDGTDCTQLHLRYSSSDPDRIAVTQRGLIQRMQSSKNPVTISISDGQSSLPITINPGA